MPLSSIRLLLESNWQANIKRIEAGLEKSLATCCDMAHVKDVRVLGAIGVVELKEPVDMKWITEQFVEAGVWVRPFGKLVYLMPPFIINDTDLDFLTSTVSKIIAEC